MCKRLNRQEMGISDRGIKTAKVRGIKARPKTVDAFDITTFF